MLQAVEGSRCEHLYYFCGCNRLLRPTKGIRQAHDMKTKQRWCLIVFVISAAVLIVMLCSGLISGRGRGARPLSLTIDLEELTERGKCPACYGVNICPAILTEKIVLSEWTKYSVTKLVNQKNIFYADWKERGVERKVVLKKLAHDNELDQLDKTICVRHARQQSCDVSDAVRFLINEYSHTSEIRPDEPILHGEKIGKGSDILLCPSHRKMDFLIDAASKFNRGQHSKTILSNVLTMLLLNPEPLLLQAFPSSQGWPFPAYYGSCGRIVAEEYVGRRLTTYYKEPFKIRALIAKQLLQIANKFSENPSNFILYLTDLSPDNFAVEENTNVVKLIDLENLVVVDKIVLITSKTKDSDKMLVSESITCENSGNLDNECFSFSTDDLCTRPLNDHNYYAVCAGLLSPGALAYEFPDGLLHSIPFPESEASQKLSELLYQCKNPSFGRLKHNREQAAQLIIELLEKFITD